MVLPYYLSSMENRCCLSCGVQVIDATWQAAMRIMPRVGDLVQRTGDVQALVVYSVADDVVCGLHHAQGDKEHGFLDLASKPRSTVYPGLASKSVASDFLVWASEPIAAVW
jgi:hypothetical protein